MGTIGTILTILSVGFTVCFSYYTAWQDKKYGKLACCILAICIAYLYFEWSVPLGLASFIMTIPAIPIFGFLPYKPDSWYYNPDVVAARQLAQERAGHTWLYHPLNEIKFNK